MTIQVLNNGATLQEQREKINANFAELNTGKAPAANIQASALSAGVQASLAKADSALQTIPASGGGILVSASRIAQLSDNEATLELASGVTYTLTNAVALPKGVAFQGPASGAAATLAVTGSATMNGATTSISIPVGKMAAAVPRASNPAAFMVTVQS